MAQRALIICGDMLYAKIVKTIKGVTIIDTTGMENISKAVYKNQISGQVIAHKS